MNIKFPPNYPLAAVSQKDVKEIARAGLPSFDCRWIKYEDPSLANIMTEQLEKFV